MSAIIAGLVLAQLSTITVEAKREQADVGYRELMADRPDDAIARIEAGDLYGDNDPAALINRGTAQARMGRIEAARDSFRAALANPERYDLQLHDGSWLDSRDAARRAIRLLESNQTLALR